MRTADGPSEQLRSSTTSWRCRMSVKVGDVAPEISGTDVVTNAPWSLYAQAKADVLLGFTQITGPNSPIEAPGLQAIWDKYNGKTVNPFKMAVVCGAPPDNPAGVKAAIAKAKFTFPVLLNPNTLPTYILPDLSLPAWYCLHWEEGAKQYRAHQLVLASSGTVQAFEGLLTNMLNNCGVTLGSSSSSGGTGPVPF